MTAVTNPASNKAGKRYPGPVKRFLEEGINLAIGTDGPASNNCLDMFGKCFLRQHLQKVREHDASCISADEVLYMANDRRCRGDATHPVTDLWLVKRQILL